MLADGLTKGGIDRTLLHAISQNCSYECKHDALRHCKRAGNHTAKSAEIRGLEHVDFSSNQLWANFITPSGVAK